MRIPIGISNRHIHLSMEDANTLFGKDYNFEKMKDISQPGQYACQETVTIKGPKGEIKNVRVLLPFRKHSQVEILRSDNYILGINAPIRLSGDLKRSERLTVIGPKGKIDLINGVIVAKRHLHITVAEAKEMKLKDGQNISIKTHGERGLVFENVVVRAKDDYTLDFHIDIDEANAAGLNPGDWGEIISMNN
ncbi:MAG TPA: phosphate propanoyltransferase [Candidatus Absconditabacterales bacterium]|nr:phosphate propanoyltransferase [Candidatus Absconditabacterales bacterium]